MSTSWDSSGPQLKAIDADGETQVAFWYDDISSNPNTLKQAFPSSNLWLYLDVNNLDYDYLGGSQVELQNPTVVYLSNARVRNRAFYTGYLDNNFAGFGLIGADGMDSNVLTVNETVACVASEILTGTTSGATAEVLSITLTTSSSLLRVTPLSGTFIDGEAYTGDIAATGTILAKLPLKQAYGTGWGLLIGNGGTYGGNAGNIQNTYGSGLSVRVTTTLPLSATPTGFNLYELVTGGTSGATGFIFEIGSNELAVYNVTGTFVDTEIVTGAGGGTGTISSPPIDASSPSSATSENTSHGNGSPGDASIAGGDATMVSVQLGIPGSDGGAGRGAAGEIVWRDNVGFTIFGIVDAKADNASTTGDFTLPSNLRVLMGNDVLIQDTSTIELGYKGNYAVSNDIADLETIISTNFTAGSIITIEFLTAGKVIEHLTDNIICPGGANYTTQINNELVIFQLNSAGNWQASPTYLL